MPEGHFNAQCAMRNRARYEWKQVSSARYGNYLGAAIGCPFDATQVYLLGEGNSLASTFGGGGTT